MKKKEVKIVGFCILTLILAYFCYKTILVYEYRVEVQEKGEKLITELEKSGETINVKKSAEDKNAKFVKYGNLIYKDFNDNFKLIDEKDKENGYGYKTYQLTKKGSSDYIAKFKIEKTNYTLYDIFASDDILVYGFNLKNINRKKLLDTYELKDSYDIVKYIVNNYKNKVNILSSSNAIKMDYFMKTFSYTTLPKAKIYLIEGDYKGYIFVMDDDSHYDVYLFNGEDKYILSFTNNEEANEQYFDLDNVKEFISNIQFEN